MARLPRRVLRYSATSGDVANMRRQIAENPEHGRPGSSLRGVLADALDETGKSGEAENLRNHPGQVVGYAHGGTNGANLYYQLGTHHFPMEMDPAVAHILINSSVSRAPLFIHSGTTNDGGDELYRAKGRDWLSERNRGTVFFSSGRIQYPLLLRHRATHGDPISSVVRVRGVGGNNLWVHPSYHHDPVTIGESGNEGVPFGVFVNGENHANFRTARARQNWIRNAGVTVSPSETTPTPDQKSRRYAKADRTRALAHDLVAGFPLEHALRHLANDPDNSDTLRQTALVALTGKRDGKVSPEGHPEALWALHDLLQDPEHNSSGKPHPLAKAYNWMSAADKIVLDRHTKQALVEAANDSKIGVPLAYHDEWNYTPEYHAQRAAMGLEKYNPDVNRSFHNHNVGIARGIKASIRQLAPVADDKLVDESIRRHAHRAAMVWRARHTADKTDESDALLPVADPAEGSHPAHHQEKASRYRKRNCIKMIQLTPRRYAEGFPLNDSGLPSEAIRYWIDPSGNTHATGNYAHHQWMMRTNGTDQDSALKSGWHKVGVLPSQKLVSSYGFAPLNARQRDAIGNLAIKHGVPEASQRVRGQLKELPVRLGRPARYAESEQHPVVTRPRGEYQLRLKHPKKRFVSLWAPEHGGYRHLGVMPYNPHQHGDYGSLPDSSEFERQQMRRTTGVPRRYAKLTIRPGEPLMGGADFMHEIRDETGNRVGHVWVSPMEGGTRLHVNHIGAMGHAANSLGPSAVRDLHRQLKAHYPAAQKITGTRISGARPNNTPVVKPMARPRTYAAPQRNDFIDALRRSRSKQMTALKAAAKQVAQRLGFTRTSAVNGLHDGPNGAQPGLVQALYGNATPEQVHSAAAWGALMSNSPGTAVFHVRPHGTDNLYRMRFQGSGLTLRAKLDRAGIRQRVLVPHKSGYDVVLPDPGGRLGPTISAFAQQNKVPLQVSRGFFKTVGDQDKAAARSQFRDTISGAERQQMARTGPKQMGRPPKQPIAPPGFDSFEDFKSHVLYLFRFGMKGTDIARHLNVTPRIIESLGLLVPRSDRPGRNKNPQRETTSPGLDPVQGIINRGVERGKKQTEIAQEMNVSPQAVNQRVGRPNPPIQSESSQLSRPKRRK